MSIKLRFLLSSVIVISFLAVLLPTATVEVQGADAGGDKSEVSDAGEKLKKHVDELKKKLEEAKEAGKTDEVNDIAEDLELIKDLLKDVERRHPDIDGDEALDLYEDINRILGLPSSAGLLPPDFFVLPPLPKPDEDRDLEPVEGEPKDELEEFDYDIPKFQEIIASVQVREEEKEEPGVISCNPEIRKLTEPMIMAMPPKASIGKKLGGALIGGLAGFAGVPGDRSEQQEDNLVSKPKGDWTTLTGSDGKTKINLLAYAQNNSTDLCVGMQVKKSSAKGTPHLVLLQHEDGRILEPTQISIFRLWAKFRLEITTWRETYVDGQLVSREHLGTEISNWDKLLGTYEMVAEGPSIWQRLGSKPFKGNRGIIAEYKIPPGFNPEKWSIIAQITGKEKDPETKKTFIKTVPFVADLSGPVLEVTKETGTIEGKKKGKKTPKENIEVAEASETRFHRNHDCSLPSDPLKFAP